jgi:DNA polymerase-3 subunit gamma/tau
VDAPLALYRRYRPETFAEVIGQDHVTTPLRHALASGRAHHAYLFSGPRGCGKTTSARILARALNCERAPVAEPCGECGSCRDLARGGPGSVDVIEIDAASHGGVDDARELREKAFFSPVNSRYKIYVIDEAHMVSPQGFNALLKLVEEPPPHLKFVFATTEPDKVIGTIRSRTHHYPFRLVPPKALTDYLSMLCEREDVVIETTALPLVVRAGGGSVRDTLSVLDQLIGGAGPDGVTYELAANLLGYTPDSLLDDVVDAFAAGDGASVFGAVDKVIESGQEPRRFAEDLLKRLRDLIIVSAVPGAVEKGLLDCPEDAAARLESQAALLGPAELARAAEVVSNGLDEIRGATAPRLLLELICARVLLPGADHGTEGVLARLDRLERRLTIAGGAPSPAATAAVEDRVHETEPPLLGARPERGQPARPADTPAPARPADTAAPARPEAPAATAAPTVPDAAATRPATAAPEVPGREQEAAPDVPAAAAQAPATDGPTEPSAATPPSGSAVAPAAPPSVTPVPTPSPDGYTVKAALTLVDVRRLWPEVLEAVKGMRRFAWVMLSQNAAVHSLDGSTLTIALVNAGARDSFARSGSDEIVRQALIDRLGVDWRVETIVDPSAAVGGPAEPTGPPAPSAGGWDVPPPPPDAAEASRPEPREQSGPPSPPRAGDGGEPDPSRGAAAQPRVVVDPQATAAARGAIRPTRSGPGNDLAESARQSDAAVHRDDPSADGDPISQDELLARELGAEVIEEIPHNG